MGKLHKLINSDILHYRYNTIE